MAGALSHILLLWLSLTLSALGDVSTSNFHIRFTPGASTHAEYFKKNCEQWKDQVERITGLQLSKPVTIIIVKNTRQYQSVQPEGNRVPLWSQAVAYPELNIIILKTHGLRSMDGAREVFIHEYSHLLLGRIFHLKPIPTWFHEGLAMYLAGEWSMSRIVTMSQAAISNRLIPLAHLTEFFPQEERMAHIAYAQSYYVISFIRDRFGPDALREFIRYYGRGFGFEDSLYRATGLKSDTFTEQWKKFVQIRFSWLPIATSAGTLWFFATLVFIAAVIRKRRRSRQILKEWEKEEKISVEKDFHSKDMSQSEDEPQ